MAAIQDLVKKLDRLRSIDRNCKLFGAGGHRYRLAPPASERQLTAFEDRYHVKLPEDYREFLAAAGNGGAGPFHGVFPLGLFDGAGTELEPWEEGDGLTGTLADPFLLTEPWNLPPERLERPHFETDDEEYEWQEGLDADLYRPDLMNGTFPICHHGCAKRTFLVVTGKERGHVWYDGRASTEPISPHADERGRRLTFAEWYDAWLEKSLRSLTVS